MILHIIIIVILLPLVTVTACAESVVGAADHAESKKQRRSTYAALSAFGMLLTVIIAVLTADLLTEPLAKFAAKWDMPFADDTVYHAISAIITVISGMIVLVLFKLVPAYIAQRSPEKTAEKLSGYTSAVRVIFAPISLTADLTTSALLHLVGREADTAEDTDAEEVILKMSDAGTENGTIDEDENRIIKNIFAFDDMTAEQICTHRTDVSMLWSEDSVEKWEETIHRTRHSRFPICGESVDEIIGILNAKDYFRLEDKSRDNIMKNAVKEPYFVHENMKADNLFAEMKKKGSDHFAVVVDEYGGMSGIITVTDLVEQLVGDFDDDELDLPELELKKIGDNTWIVPGNITMGELCEELDIELTADRYDTFGGYVIGELGEIPKDGTKTFIECDGLHIDVLKIHHHRVEICKVRKMTE